MGEKNVQEKIQLLKELQGLDQELNRIRQQRRELEAEQAEQQADLERILAMVDSLNADIEGLQTEKGELNQGLAREKEAVEKAEGRLPGIKTQKEYVAVLKEIDTAKKQNKDIQEKIEAKEAEIDTLKRDQEEKDEELAALREKMGGRAAEISAAMAEFDQALGEKEEKHGALLGQLPTQVRKRYQLLLDRRGGVAVVEARNGACQGCNMHLPPQLFNSLFLVAEIQSCPHCNRLLYVEQEPAS
jgi:predicted  nucleic acid-binding Zn-ribbon protein